MAMGEKKVNPIIYSLDELETIATKYLLPEVAAGRIFTFTGFLGAGKTTLIKEFIRQLGVTDEVTSPTFAYVNTYQAPQGVRVHHFDLYRVESIEQFQDLGFDEYLRDSNGICLIEWPEVIAQLLQDEYPEQVMAVNLSHLEGDGGQRGFEISN